MIPFDKPNLLTLALLLLALGVLSLVGHWGAGVLFVLAAWFLVRGYLQSRLKQVVWPAVTLILVGLIPVLDHYNEAVNLSFWGGLVLILLGAGLGFLWYRQVSPRAESGGIDRG